jgi:DHA1 family tetracycline resistance protein-like MFS transporter
MLNRRNAAMSFIFVTVALDMLALGVMIPVFPTLIKSFTGEGDAAASLAVGALAVVWSVAQFVASPILGVLSDRFGRRSVLLGSTFGSTIDYIIMALAPALSWLYVGRALSGVFSATVPTASAYIADVTSEDQRAGAYGMIGAAFGLGFVVGPALGGWLGGYDARLPFWVAAGFTFANFCYGLFVLPESLPPAKRRATFEWKRANPLGSLRLLRSHRELFGIASVTFIGYIAHEAYTIYVLYGQHRYGWNTAIIGFSLAIVGICSAVLGAGLSGRAVATFGARKALLGGFFFGAVGLALYASPVAWVFWLAIPVNALWAIAGSAEQAYMTRHVRADEQGELQGALGSIRSVAMIGAPMLFAAVFSHFITPGQPQVPGAPWYLASALLFVSFAIAWSVLRSEGRDDHLASVESRGDQLIF